MNEKLSICIVAYNDFDDIEQAIESIESYTDHTLRKNIYVVDNSGSRSSVFEEKMKKYSDVTYLPTGENLGFGKGHNYVMPQLGSEYHAIVNPDIILKEDAFSTIIKFMDENPDVGMVIPNITDEEGKRQLVYRKELTVFDMFIRMFCRKVFKKRFAKHTLQDADYTMPFQVPFGQGSFLVVRTSLFKHLNGFDDGFFMYLEDADLCRRVNCVSKLMYLPEANVIHKWKQESHTNKTLFKIHLQSMNYYFKKWGYKWI